MSNEMEDFLVVNASINNMLVAILLADNYYKDENREERLKELLASIKQGLADGINSKIDKTVKEPKDDVAHALFGEGLNTQLEKKRKSLLGTLDHQIQTLQDTCLKMLKSK